MHEYVASLATLKTMMHMISDGLDWEAQVVYLDTIKVKVRFQMDLTMEHTDTIRDNRAWYQYVIFY